MKYVKIIKYAKADENGNRYELILRYANGKFVQPYESVDRFRTKIQALIWAYKWNTIIKKGGYVNEKSIISN